MSSPPIDADRELGLITLVEPGRHPRAGSILQDEYDLDAPWHHHDIHQLQYAFEGAMELEDGHGRHVLPRSLAGWIPAGTRHRNSLHRIRSVSILLDRDSIPDAGSRVRILKVSPLMREMIAEAVRWQLDRPLDDIGTAFYAAFAKLCGEWIIDEAPLSLPTTSDPALGRALSYTRANPAESQMAAAANAAGMSERSLRRRSQAQLGMGWDEFRRRARLLTSIEALTESDDTIARVAAGVGFESQSAYARAFRELLGVSPQTFRAQSRRH